MKTRNILLVILLAAVTVAQAIPAKPGIRRVITLSDGTTLSVELTGDEYLHYWQSADGRTFDDNGTLITPFTLQQQRVKAAQRRSKSQTSNLKSQTSNLKPQPSKALTGDKRGLIILVEFSDLTFKRGHNRQLYNRIANEEGFTNSDGFQGSVHDYFLDQSRNLFNLTFDVMGPVPMPKPYSYYGQNGGSLDFDLHPGEMLIEACQAIDDEVNFADYDWNGDGIVDQVMMIYAGQGENGGGGSNTVWPHEWNLTEAEGAPIVLDDMIIDTYACSNELQGSQIEGIGTICHEFSHCLGLPDFYDTQYTGNYGMGNWSVMGSGSYNGGSFIPAGYTSYERMCSGWLDPIVLQGEMDVTDMAALTEGGIAYILYNDAYPDEFYMLENRQPNSWDSALSDNGLLILHIDYDEMAWYWNLVNSCADLQDEEYYGPGAVNDHQRCTIFHANNKAISWGATYPYNDNNSLTPESTPAATLFNPNSNGELTMNAAITDITESANGIISFHCVAPEPTAITPPRINLKSQISNLKPQPYYTLEGRPVDHPSKGIFIHQGKKIVVK